jgi:hypothetical protein
MITHDIYVHTYQGTIQNILTAPAPASKYPRIFQVAVTKAPKGSSEPYETYVEELPTNSFYCCQPDLRKIIQRHRIKLRRERQALEKKSLKRSKR